MARYIDANKLIHNLYDEYHGMISDESMKIYKIIRMLDNAPTADVQEVKYGKWKKAMPRRKGRNATYRCSCCGQLRSSYYNDVQNWEYCPCGAKMEGAKE